MAEFTSSKTYDELCELIDLMDPLEDSLEGVQMEIEQLLLPYLERSVITLPDIRDRLLRNYSHEECEHIMRNLAVYEYLTGQDKEVKKKQSQKENPLETLLSEHTISQTLFDESEQTIIIQSVEEADCVLLYHPWNLDSQWYINGPKFTRRILVLDPEFFEFSSLIELATIIEQAQKDIPGIEIFRGKPEKIPGMQELLERNPERVRSRGHKNIADFPGIQEEAPKLYPEVEGNFETFPEFWSACKEAQEKRAVIFQYDSLME